MSDGLGVTSLIVNGVCTYISPNFLRKHQSDTSLNSKRKFGHVKSSFSMRFDPGPTLPFELVRYEVPSFLPFKHGIRIC